MEQFYRDVKRDRELAARQSDSFASCAACFWSPRTQRARREQAESQPRPSYKYSVVSARQVLYSAYTTRVEHSAARVSVLSAGGSMLRPVPNRPPGSETPYVLI